MSIDRTKYNLLVDDDGSNTVGTLWNKTQVKDVVMDPIDAMVTNWVTFVPTWTNLTVGNGTLSHAKWARHNKTILVEVLFVLGTTSSVTGAVGIASLPASNLALATSQRIGAATFFDSSAGLTYGGAVLTGGSTTAALMSAVSPFVAVAATVPFTWATGDQIHLFLTYQEP